MSLIIRDVVTLKNLDNLQNVFALSIIFILQGKNRLPLFFIVLELSKKL